MEIIQRGAEAILIKEKNRLIKRRIEKGYRIREIDEKIRKFRTRREAKLLKQVEFAPNVIDSDDKKMEIAMDFIEGELVRDILDNLNEKDRKKLCLEIGEKIGKMHDLDVIHGDLTTSNMIVRTSPYQPQKEEIFFIDFGLGFVSKRVEDKATDLRLLRQVLESKHFKNFEKNYEWILSGYKKSKNSNEVLDWLKNKVEKRGRYKRKAK